MGCVHIFESSSRDNKFQSKLKSSSNREKQSVGTNKERGPNLTLIHISENFGVIEI